jgi:three-Cys-motif partner protein
VAGNESFFDTRRPQAVFKHGILSRYALYFAGRAGHATGGRVAIIDGYAGEGRYQDGNPGSPLLLGAAAVRAEAIRREVKLAFVEADRARRERLRRSLDDEAIRPDIVIGRPFEEAVDELLHRYHDRAVLIFVDPFGLAISYDTLKKILARSGPKQPIDVIYHFSLLSVGRMGRAALVDGTVPHNERKLDHALGPTDWRTPLAAIPDEDGAATEAAGAIAREFSRRVQNDTGVPSLGVPVRERPGHLPKYTLTLFSRDPVNRALWDFADAASQAHVGWLQQCELDTYLANMRREQERGMLSLFGDPLLRTKDQVETALAAEVHDDLIQHLTHLFDKQRALVPASDVAATYGDQLGRAGIKHLRRALNELIRTGKVIGDAGAAFQNRTFESVRS